MKPTYLMVAISLLVSCAKPILPNLTETAVPRDTVTMMPGSWICGDGDDNKFEFIFREDGTASYIVGGNRISQNGEMVDYKFQINYAYMLEMPNLTLLKLSMKRLRYLVNGEAVSPEAQREALLDFYHHVPSKDVFQVSFPNAGKLVIESTTIDDHECQRSAG